MGEIYKIRISHDNAGDSPGWLCDEVGQIVMCDLVRYKNSNRGPFSAFSIV